MRAKRSMRQRPRPVDWVCRAASASYPRLVLSGVLAVFSQTQPNRQFFWPIIGEGRIHPSPSQFVETFIIPSRRGQKGHERSRTFILRRSRCCPSDTARFESAVLSSRRIPKRGFSPVLLFAGTWDRQLSQFTQRFSISRL